MRYCVAIVLGVTLLAAIARQDARAANVNDFVDFSLRSGATTLLPGRLYVPPESVTDPDTLRPFILFLHGGGEAGTNNTAQVNVNIDHLLAEAKRRGAFLYAPQSTTNWSGVTLTDRVKSMIDRAVGERPVDANRLYVTGLSNGGGGTWNMLSRYPDSFAAGIPICGVAPASDFVPLRLVDQHIAAFHARNDPVVSFATSRNVVNRVLNAAPAPLPMYPPTGNQSDFFFGSDVIDLSYAEPATGGHGIWTTVYRLPQVYDWLFSQSLVPEPGSLSMAVLAAAWAIRERRRRRPMAQV